ncbi:hypothetical protein [Pseudoalteromonas sp. SG45-2]|uniref:hypothetical protein n=1 Tax=Pseudoalteromonas sp. SG45-2 TaxID=2760956 RepID=UPI0015FF30E4|nr:hypothetical protein [Pseudoalteromonas sp. SG45-2]MBB1344481.1 hypothetical protein [Pseudoalteromonas sp. SG45-2]
MNISKLDISVLLRAISIFSIVAGHFHWLGIAGGAYYLIFLSGFNFVLFTAKKAIDSKVTNAGFNAKKFYRIYFSFIWKIVLPTLLYTVFLYSVLGEFHIGGLLLISNFYGPDYANGLTFWFIEVLIQIYLLFSIVFYINTKFFVFHKSPYYFMLVGFLVSYTVSIICRLTWDTSYYLDRLPHLMIYMFFAGGMAALSKNIRLKMITTSALSIILMDLIYFGWSSRILFLYFGSLFTIWLPYILIPRVINKIVTIVAFSSMFIYLTHFQTLSLLNKIFSSVSPGLAVLMSFLVGIVITKVWKKRHSYLERMFTILHIKENK